MSNNTQQTVNNIDAIRDEYDEKVAVLRKMAKDVMQFLPSDLYGLAISRKTLEVRDMLDSLAEDVETSGYIVVMQMIDAQHSA